MEKSNTCSIVLGLFFGDEGKGVTTASLAPDKNSLVIRFNGGFQAGHTVVKGDHRHVFSSFGSGTLNGAATYWSEYCPFYPTAFYNELNVLSAKGIAPNIYVHPLAPVTTPWDVAANKQWEKHRKHGSVGVGFGSTVGRHTETPYKLYAKDIFYKDIFLYKIQMIREYYEGLGIAVEKEIWETYLAQAESVADDILITPLSQIQYKYTNFVFEGAQGIMLDQDFGFFPNVTRSHTTSRNAMQIIKENNLPEPDVYYVMRSYLTRHGNGYMPGEFPIKLSNNEKETNVNNEWQGDFRKGFHSNDLICYVLDCDSVYSKNCNRNFVVTCMDQTQERIMINDAGVPLKNFFTSMMFSDIKKIFASRDGEFLNLEIDRTKVYA